MCCACPQIQIRMAAPVRSSEAITASACGTERYNRAPQVTQCSSISTRSLSLECSVVLISPSEKLPRISPVPSIAGRVRQAWDNAGYGTGRTGRRWDTNGREWDVGVWSLEPTMGCAIMQERESISQMKYHSLSLGEHRERTDEQGNARRGASCGKGAREPSAAAARVSLWRV